MPSSIHRITDLDPVQGGMGYVSTCRLLSSRKSTRGAHRRARETGTVPYHPRTRFHPCTAAARVVSSSHPCPDVFLLLFTHTAEPPHPQVFTLGLHGPKPRNQNEKCQQKEHQPSFAHHITLPRWRRRHMPSIGVYARIRPDASGRAECDGISVLRQPDPQQVLVRNLEFSLDCE